MILALRFLLVFFGLWGARLLLENYLTLGVDWESWVIPVGGAIGVEVVIACYRFEREAVGIRRGRVLLGLRLGVLMLLLWVLLQPVWTGVVSRRIDQQLVILVDDSASMSLVDEGASESRLTAARAVLEKSGLKDEVEGKLLVREVLVARGTLEGEESPVAGWNQATDLEGALNSVMDSVPPDELAGVVLLTDGRHNRPGSVEDAARRFGILNAPIAVIGAGSEVPPQDVAIVSVEAPDSVYLGDRIRVKAKLKFDGYRGKSTTVKLYAGEEEIEAKKVSIPQRYHREEVRFQHVPEKGGVGEYRVVLASLEGERFAENNEWSFQTVVTDARTNVLLVDSTPRWEFRYLRNLFYGRDKSIHLQSVLLEGDRVSGQQKEIVEASADRRFGDTKATALPTKEEEWRKFDVIILGDIKPSTIMPEQWGMIRRCVEERGALLVMVAGPSSMPHAFGGGDVDALMPVEYQVSRRTYFGGGESFKMSLTGAGKLHPVLAQAEGMVKNEQVWAGFPEVRWRHPIDGVKAGAEVLVYAESEEKQQVGRESELRDALAGVLNRKKREAERAILVTRQTGNGKVAVLLSDRTWRLREGVGDVYHHRFWGQLVRWGAGPNLRAGTRTTRLGTDQLTYTGDDPVKVLVRLWDESLNPRNQEEVAVQILHEGESVARARLKHRPDSNGFYEATLRPFSKSGQYEIVLSGTSVKTGFRVVGALSGAELSETTLNRALIENVVRLSGGQLVDPEASGNLGSLFLGRDGNREELTEISLWDKWPVLALLVIFLTTEWILRRRGGLS